MNKPDPKLIRSLARLRLGIAFLRGAVRGNMVCKVLSLRRYVDTAAHEYRLAADLAPNDPINTLAKARGMIHLIIAKQACDEASSRLRGFLGGVHG